MRVTCKSCGRSYDYNREGTCPDCGAFNRPPRRDKVNADGTVRHLTSEEFLEKGHGARSGKVCFEEKECYEQKECHEDVARQVRSQAQNVRKQVQKVRSARPATAKSSGGKGQSSAVTRLLIIGAVIFFLIIIGNVFSMTSSWSHEFKEEFGIGWQDIFSREPEPVVSDDDMALRFFKIGNEFKWNGYLIEVRSWTQEGNRGTANIKCTGPLKGSLGITFGEQVLSAQLPFLQYTEADKDVIICDCNECSVEEDMRMIHLSYETIEGDFVKQQLVLYCYDTMQKIYVDLDA